MEFLPKNKYLALLVFILIVVVSVIAAMSILKLKPDPKNAGLMRFTVGSRTKTLTPKI